MAERSVGGTVELAYAQSGLAWRLTCPEANALESGEREQMSGAGESRVDGVIRHTVPETIRSYSALI